MYLAGMNSIESEMTIDWQWDIDQKRQMPDGYPPQNEKLTLQSLAPFRTQMMSHFAEKRGNSAKSTFAKAHHLMI